ncbi:hypothetical protein ElyMa_005291500 [Elysia marginata]|uniref:L-Fucosyltransferase n=1 Tax=Elysia marginata TaxID=1093978 RepID=A0AAV4JZ09_9GAST|nr:hypothetical protein ElyMa_005291500 [Elysia marginata]
MSKIRQARLLMKLLSLAVALVILAELGLLKSDDSSLRVKHDMVVLTSQLPSNAYWSLNSTWLLKWHTTGKSASSSLAVVPIASIDDSTSLRVNSLPIKSLNLHKNVSRNHKQTQKRSGTTKIKLLGYKNISSNYNYLNDSSKNRSFGDSAIKEQKQSIIQSQNNQQVKLSKQQLQPELKQQHVTKPHDEKQPQQTKPLQPQQKSQSQSLQQQQQQQKQALQNVEKRQQQQQKQNSSLQDKPSLKQSQIHKQPHEQKKPQQQLPSQQKDLPPLQGVKQPQQLPPQKQQRQPVEDNPAQQKKDQTIIQPKDLQKQQTKQNLPEQEQKQTQQQSQDKQKQNLQQATKISNRTVDALSQNKAHSAKNNGEKHTVHASSGIPLKPDCIPGYPSTGTFSARQRYLQWQEGKDLDRVTKAIGPDLVLDPGKYLIYRCDTGLMDGCCGWADRVRGILGGYLMANLTGRVFKVEILDQGCSFTSFYIPNKVNWSLPHSIHQALNNASKDIQILDVVNDHSFSEKLAYLNLSNVINSSAKFVYFKGNLNFLVHLRNSQVYKSQLAWMQRVGWHRIHAILFRRLFKLAPKLKSKLDAFLLSAKVSELDRPKPLVCAHVRVGDSIAFFKNFHNRMEFPSLDNVWRFITNKSIELNNQLFQNQTKNIPAGDVWKETKVFVTSDSSKVLDIARNQSFGSAVVAVPGEILHVDKNEAFSPEAKCRGLEKLLLEQAVLMNCDALMISHSGVSTQAASVRSSHSQLYIFTETYDVKPFRLYC